MVHFLIVATIVASATIFVAFAPSTLGKEPHELTLHTGYLAGTGTCRPAFFDQGPGPGVAKPEQIAGMSGLEMETDQCAPVTVGFEAMAKPLISPPMHKSQMKPLQCQGHRALTSNVMGTMAAGGMPRCSTLHWVAPSTP